MLMPSVMEMIAALGPGAAPFTPLQPPRPSSRPPGQGEYAGLALESQALGDECSLSLPACRL